MSSEIIVTVVLTIISISVLVALEFHSRRNARKAESAKEKDEQQTTPETGGSDGDQNR